MDEGLRVAPEVLGIEEPTALEMTDNNPPELIAIKIGFPADAKDSEGQLTSPPISFPELSTGQQWGVRQRNYVTVSSLLLTVDFPIEEGDIRGRAHIFADSCVPWVRQLVDWLSVLTGQLVGTRHRPVLPPVDGSHIAAGFSTETGIKRLQWVILDRGRPKKQEPARLIHLKHALEHLARGEEASLPHRLLIGAHTELYRNAYDRAVISAYVAMETALARVKGINPEAVRSLLKPSKWRNLQGEWPRLPSHEKMKESLIRVRDDVAHTGLRPADATKAWGAYFVAKEVVTVLSEERACSISPTEISCPGGEAPSP